MYGGCILLLGIALPFLAILAQSSLGTGGSDLNSLKTARPIEPVFTRCAAVIWTRMRAQSPISLILSKKGSYNIYIGRKVHGKEQAIFSLQQEELALVRSTLDVTQRFAAKSPPDRCRRLISIGRRQPNNQKALSGLILALSRERP